MDDGIEVRKAIKRIVIELLAVVFCADGDDFFAEFLLDCRVESELVQKTCECARSRVLASKDERAANEELSKRLGRGADLTYLTWPRISDSGSLSFSLAFMFSFTKSYSEWCSWQGKGRSNLRSTLRISFPWLTS